jgi:carbamoyltransferase
VVGRIGPRRRRLARLGTAVALPVLRRFMSRIGFVEAQSRPARECREAVEAAIREGRETYLLGIGVGLHNAGAALIRVTAGGTVELVCNEEEERYTAVKHCPDYPEHSLAAVRRRLDELGVDPGEIAAVTCNFDYAHLLTTVAVRAILEEIPTSFGRRLKEGTGDAMHEDFPKLISRSADRLAGQLGLEERMPIVGMRHHDNHAYFSYAASPFAADGKPAMVLVLDGSGDDCSTSLYEVSDGEPRLLGTQGLNNYDSLGMVYGILSSSQGGWPILSSEGRYMGAAAWGDGDRVSNRYYRRLRQIVHFGSDGEVRVNRALANWTRGGMYEPYGEELIDILGEPIPLEQMWHPDAILDVEDVRHPELTRDRVDKAAAVQMVFEDGLTHIVEHLIRETGGDRLVLTGGTALNCVANTRLLECFDEAWYERHLGRADTRLQLWVPPTPGDAGTPMGAAFAFAMQAGAKPGRGLQHAFYCGTAPAAAEIEAAVAAEPSLESIPLGSCAEPQGRRRVADLLAHLVAGDRIVGLCQGASETGPRALGHRSILANPCNPETRRLLNERVKHRELIRPLAPMLTRAAAERLFELQPGAAADDYNAYNYMVLTARARPEARELIPSVIHHDGTGRLQIVRPEADPLCHEYLLAMGRRVGVEASVNTSLNVGAPIAHTAEQAVTTLRRAKGMDGLLLVDAEGEARLLWLADREEAARRLLDAVGEWAAASGFALPETMPGWSPTAS